MLVRATEPKHQELKHGIANVWSGSSRRMSVSPGRCSLYSRIKRGKPAHVGSIRAWIRSQSDRAEAPAKYVSRMDMVGTGVGTCGDPQGVNMASDRWTSR